MIILFNFLDSERIPFAPWEKHIKKKFHAKREYCKRNAYKFRPHTLSYLASDVFHFIFARWRSIHNPNDV